MKNTSKTDHRNKLVLTVPQVADELQVTPRHVWALIERGDLPSIKVGGSRRITREQLDAYLRTGSVA